MAYLVSSEEETEPTYTLYIQGNDKVYLDSGVSLFAGFIHLLGIEGLEYVDTSRVTNMSSMFYACSSLTGLVLNSFDTSQVTDMSYMFDNCSSLVSLDLSQFNTIEVIDMEKMFYWCENLEKLNIKNFSFLKLKAPARSFFVSVKVSYIDISNIIYESEKNIQDLIFSTMNSFLVAYTENKINNGQIIVKDEEIKALFEEQLAQYNQVPEYADFNINIILASN